MRIRRTLRSLWLRLGRGSAEQRTRDARARFWAEVREGERDAEARTRS
jgi:hypothetical protein